MTLASSYLEKTSSLRNSEGSRNYPRSSPRLRRIHKTKTVFPCMFCHGQINRIKHVLDMQTLITVINTLVFSKLYYCSNVWANTTGKDINKLQSVQNFACHIVSGARKYDHDSCYTTFKRVKMASCGNSIVLS